MECRKSTVNAIRSDPDTFTNGASTMYAIRKIGTQFLWSPHGWSRVTSYISLSRETLEALQIEGGEVIKIS